MYTCIRVYAQGTQYVHPGAPSWAVARRYSAGVTASTSTGMHVVKRAPIVGLWCNCGGTPPALGAVGHAHERGPAPPREEGRAALCHIMRGHTSRASSTQPRVLRLATCIPPPTPLDCLRPPRHDAVYRMNKAPAGTKKWAEHVGHRTTMRVWADQRMPDLSDVWRAANETIVLYCGPTQAVLYCWWSLPATGRPRFSPLAWQQASLSIRGASKLPAAAAIRQFPSSGAMAVWLALAQCASVAQHVTKWQLFGRATVDDVVGEPALLGRIFWVSGLLCAHTRREPWLAAHRSLRGAAG